MNSNQLAKAHCDCYNDGACLGVTLNDKLSLIRFRPENSTCLLAAPVKRCSHFEQCVLPMEKRDEWAKDSRQSARLAAEFREGAHEYRIRTGCLSSTIRLCPQCRVTKISDGRKLCDLCKAQNRRQSQHDYNKRV